MTQYRKEKKRPLKKQFLILCEGETEVLYFKTFRKENRVKLSAVDVIPYKPINHDPNGLVEQAIKEKKKGEYEKIWVVFDRDCHHKIDTAQKKAQVNKINIAYSNICFEFWILLHFEETSRAFRSKDELVKYLKKEHNHAKDINHYDKLKPNMKLAIERAKKLKKENQKTTLTFETNPQTNIHEIITDLLDC